MRQLVSFTLVFAVLSLGSNDLAGASSQYPQLERFAVPSKMDHACGWRLVKSDDGPSANNHLYGVAADSPSDVWAVGSYEHGSGSFRTLAERWNGTAWSAVSTPNTGSGDNDLYGVAALSSSDVWAVGLSNPKPTSPQQTLIEHFDGSAWSIVPNPIVGQLSILGNVAAVSANDVWAVGLFYNSAGNAQTLIEHWNGRVWKVIASPSPGLSSNTLGGLAVVSSRDIWATGSQSSDGSTSTQTLIEHWDGTQWSVVASPSPGGYSNGLGSLAVIGANDIWAVGALQNSSSAPTTHTLAEHWDGSKWTVVSTPDGGGGGNTLGGVAARSSNDVWANGTYILTGGQQYRTLSEHWDGKRWKIVPSRSPGPLFNGFAAITAIGGALWTVGEYVTSNGVGNALTEFHC